MLSTQHGYGSAGLATQQRKIQFEELSIASLQEAHLVPLGNPETMSLAGFSEFCESEMDESLEGIGFNNISISKFCQIGSFTTTKNS